MRINATHTTSLAALSATALLLGSTPALAQDASTPTAPAEEATNVRDHAPDTDNCPHSLKPPEPRTTSENAQPGQTSPAPLPISDNAESCGITIPAGFEVPENQTASAWLIFDIDSGEIIAEKDPHGRYRPASVIKVLLATLAIDELDLAKTIEATEEDAAIEGSLVGIGPGGKYTNEELLHGLLLASGNDAAHALARQLGSDEEVLAKINALAKELGATDTRVASYSGLDKPGMATSAHDLALFYRHAWEKPEFAKIVNTDHIKFPGYGEYEGYEVWNDNHLFLNDPDGIGGKTGYTDDANHTFVGALDRNGRRLAIVLLDTTIDKARPWEQAQAFLHEAYKVPAGAGIGSLLPPEPVTSTVPTSSAAAPTTTAAAPVKPVKRASRNWIPYVIVAAVIALFALVLALSTNISARPPRRRGGRGNRGRRS